MLKILAAYIAGVGTAFAFAAGAATLTITTTAAMDTRIAAAFGDRLQLGRPATGPEVKAEVINFVRQIVQQYERELAGRNADVTGLDPT